jgi:acyl dehydratase
MNASGNQLSWSDLNVGQVITHRFKITEAMMEIFKNFSGDNSAIHRDVEFAHYHGFNDRVVYGAIQIAQLSYLVGMLLPGDFGLASDWHISFRSPLYINDEACMEAEVVHLSSATRTVKLKFKIDVDGRVIATGTAQSILLGPAENVQVA